ncbi:MAG: diguanylate phosphodiesterase [Desulfomicrobiaceae bacterium]|nr:diguanylate phosphodiesterase [Desulfomicrobiaceae bacterium]
MVDVRALVAARRVMVHFQPIVSLRRRQVIGYEALARGVGEHGAIPPLALFEAARQQGLALELDRLCRETALRTFVASSLGSAMLFLNVDPTALTATVVGSQWIRRMAEEVGIHPSSVVIEIAEKQVTDAQLLYDFAKQYRQQGFLIALDDFGAAHSNLDRLAQVTPDIIKIDRGLVQGAHQSSARRLLLHSLADLCRRQGALGLAEGVENAAEALALAAAGFDLFQGYFFGRPAEASAASAVAAAQTAHAMATEFEKCRRRSLVTAKRRSRELLQRVQEMVHVLRQRDPSEFGVVLEEIVRLSNDVDCIFVTDVRGIQISTTVCQNRDHGNGSMLFQKAPPGTDHGIKDYIAVPRRLHKEWYISSRYVSYATRSICRTVSYAFKARDGRSYFLCVDFIEEDFDQLFPVGDNGYDL